jgi:hypothetical protein
MILNSTLTPFGLILTISPVAFSDLREFGSEIVMAISCPMVIFLSVWINAPPELRS